MKTTLMVVAACVAVAAGIGTALFRRRAQAWGLIDIPNERSLHLRATPRGGGIVLVAAVLAGLGAMAWGGLRPSQGGLYALAMFGAASLVVALIGWRDDFRSLRPALKFPAHLAAAVATAAVWGWFDRLALPGGRELLLPAAACVVVTLVWLVGLLNAYNFMDGIDGIASGQGVIAGLMWAWAGGMDVPLVTCAGVLIAAASAGFLWHNRPPARIFLGDAGSGFLGFAFAALPLIAYRESGDARFFLAGVLIMWPFVFDTAFTLARRLVRGENLLQAHRTHLYQRLVTSGWSHAHVTALYLALAFVCGVAGVLWLRGIGAWLPVVVVALVCLLLPVVTRAERRVLNVQT